MIFYLLKVIIVIKSIKTVTKTAFVKLKKKKLDLISMQRSRKAHTKSGTQDGDNL